LLKELLAKLPTIKGIIQDKLSYYMKSCQGAADRFSPPFHLVGNLFFLAPQMFVKVTSSSFIKINVLVKPII